MESGTDKNIEQVFFQNSSNAWGCGEEGLLLKSTNGGLSWSSFVLDSGYNLSGITFKQQTGWVTGYNSSFESAVFKTTNNGESWQKVFIDSAFTYYSVYFADSMKGWIAGDYGIIKMTTDGGNTWQTVFETNFGFLSSIKFINPSVGFASGENDVVVKTTDGGLTWEQLLTGEMEGSNWEDVFFVDETRGFVCGWTGKYAYTNDGGKNWNVDYFFNPAPSLFAVVFIDSNNGWMVGGDSENSFIARTTNGGLTVVEEETDIIPSQFILYQNYPNPFNSETKIKFALPEKSVAKIEIFNSIGERVVLLNNKEMKAGVHTLNFNADGLSSGIYLCRLSVSSFAASQKIILMK